MEIDWPLYHWHLEPSSVCTLKCPRCPRTEFPNTPWINKNMSLALSSDIEIVAQVTDIYNKNIL